jgi:hypothetical protein
VLIAEGPSCTIDASPQNGLRKFKSLCGSASRARAEREKTGEGLRSLTVSAQLERAALLEVDGGELSSVAVD